VAEENESEISGEKQQRMAKKRKSAKKMASKCEAAASAKNASCVRRNVVAINNQ
jgi:hypothetical protein